MVRPRYRVHIRDGIAEPPTSLCGLISWTASFSSELSMPNCNKCIDKLAEETKVDE